MRTSSSPTASRTARSATCTTPSGSQAPLPCASLCAGTPKRIRPGTPSETRRLASTTSESSECCTSPGMDAIGTGSAIPSRTKSGATRSSGPRRASATNRRSAGVRRKRRNRRTGNPPGVHGDVASAISPAYGPSITPGAQLPDQLVDDALGRRAPRLVHADEPHRPSRRGRRRSDAHDVRRRDHRTAGLGPQGHKRLHGRGGAERQRIGCGNPVQQGRLGRGARHGAIGLDPAHIPSLRREPVGNGVGSEVGAREQDPAHTGVACVGEILDKPACAVLGGHQVGLHAVAHAARPPWPVPPRRPTPARGRARRATRP